MADPEFPIGRARTFLARHQCMVYLKFQKKKLHEIQKILGREGGARDVPLHPPLALWNFHIHKCFKVMLSAIFFFFFFFGVAT